MQGKRSYYIFYFQYLSGPRILRRTSTFSKTVWEYWEKKFVNTGKFGITWGTFNKYTGISVISGCQQWRGSAFEISEYSAPAF